MMAIKRILIMSLLLLIIGNCGQDFAAADDDVDDDGGAEKSYSHIFGPEGRSVKYDPDDKTPYLICAKYMPNECNSTENESCSTTENCRVSSRSDRLACMAVLSRNANGSGSMQVTLKGCWNHDEAQLRDCNTDKCIAEPRSIGNSAQTMFCCCRTHNCNAVVHTNHREEQEEDNETTNNNKSINAAATPTQTRITDINDPFWTVFTILIPFVLLTCLIVVIYFVYRRFRNKKLIKGRDHHHLMTYPIAQSIALDGVKTVPEFEKLSRRIKPMEIVARGRFGQVFRGEMGSSVVAVKVFPADDAESWMQEQEIYALPSMKNHPNILQYVGADKQGDEYWLITMYQERGSLCDYLRTNTLSTTESLTIITSMLRGLTFLHEEIVNRDGKLIKPTIVHRDFKSRNVMLNADLVASIGDFGLALRCENGRTPQDTHGQVGTRRYMSPEVLEGATEFSAFAFRQIDVYAAALVIWEILQRTRFDDGPVEPYQLPYEAEVGLHPTVSEIREVVVTQKRRPVTRPIARQHMVGSVIVKAMEEMWDMEPDGRITAGCVLERLNTIASSMPSYLLMNGGAGGSCLLMSSADEHNTMLPPPPYPGHHHCASSQNELCDPLLPTTTTTTTQLLHPETSPLIR